MNKEDIIKICDLYKEGYEKLCDIMNTNMNAYCKERDEMLEAELAKKGGGHEYVHNWAKNYVLDNLIKL